MASQQFSIPNSSSPSFVVSNRHRAKSGVNVSLGVTPSPLTLKPMIVDPSLTSKNSTSLKNLSILPFVP